MASAEGKIETMLPYPTDYHRQTDMLSAMRLVCLRRDTGKNRLRPSGRSSRSPQRDIATARISGLTPALFQAIA